MHFEAPVKKFVSDRSGQFAIIFSLCLIPIFAGVGMAVDYTYLVQSKTRLQDATDAAALFAARQYRLTGKLPPKSKVLDFVDADYAKVSSENVPSISLYKMEDGKIHLETKVVTPLNIMGLFGKKNSNTQVASIVNVGADQELEIALALDTTFSMTKPSGASSDQLDPTGEFLPPGTTNVDRITALKVAALKPYSALRASQARAASRLCHFRGTSTSVSHNVGSPGLMFPPTVLPPARPVPIGTTRWSDTRPNARRSAISMTASK
jgi:Flp pilus assembly protein TadG